MITLLQAPKGNKMAASAKMTEEIHIDYHDFFRNWVL